MTKYFQRLLHEQQVTGGRENCNVDDIDTVVLAVLKVLVQPGRHRVSASRFGYSGAEAENVSAPDALPQTLHIPPPSRGGPLNMRVEHVNLRIGWVRLMLQPSGGFTASAAARLCQRFSRWLHSGLHSTWALHCVACTVVLAARAEAK